MMKVRRWLFALIIFACLQVSCKSNQETNCQFIENQSGKIEILDIDSSCYYADRLNNYGTPLFIYINDSLPSDPLMKFYLFSGFKKQSADQHVVLFISAQNKFTVLYSENMKSDSLLGKRHEFGKFVYDELKKEKSISELSRIYLKFDELFLAKSPASVPVSRSEINH